MKISSETASLLMKEALLEAEKAFHAEEVPVGAVISYRGKIIARAYNEVEQRKDATAHAEMLAISRASEAIGDWRLSESILCVTLEPCSMCTGASRLSRIPAIIYGVSDERMGACGSIYDLSVDKRMGPVPRVIAGVEAEKCLELLQKFFRGKRKREAR